MVEYIVYGIFAYCIAHHFGVIYYQWRREWSKKSNGGTITKYRKGAAHTPRVIVEWKR